MNPEIIYGGMTAERTYILPNFSTADSWDLKAKLINSTGSADIGESNSTGDGTSWTIQIPAASLSSLTSGRYTLQLIAFDGSTEQIALAERVEFFAADATDLRSTEEVQLEAIEAVLESKATRDQMSVSYEGRSISRIPWDDLLNARDRLRRDIKRKADRASGNKRIKTVGLRFTDA